MIRRRCAATSATSLTVTAKHLWVRGLGGTSLKREATARKPCIKPPTAASLTPMGSSFHDSTC
ncbi:MAG: hypothetical protein ACFNPY_05900 [Peptidiphaga sp.]